MRNKNFFKQHKKDANSNARTGEVVTDHSTFQTPIFMPVGTSATVKTMDNRDLHEAGADIILGNTYHLYLQPGTDILHKAGGMHKFMGWDKSVLTDSGGFQVFSLNGLRKITEAGVEFRSHKDGSKHMFTPERAIEIQKYIGGDIIMSFDECPPGDAPREYIRKSLERTTRWAQRGFDEFHKTEGFYGYNQFLFGINQGGVHEDLRKQSMDELLDMDFDGYSIGGLSVGEATDDMYRISHYMGSIMPEDKPRYLMGVGKPEDILEGIEAGIDMFDCVYPTRNARNATVYTFKGKVNIKNKVWHDKVHQPIDVDCDCYACKNFSVGYIHHLFRANETLALKLASIHNIHFYLDLTRKSREMINKGVFKKWKDELVKVLPVIRKE